MSACLIKWLRSRQLQGKISPTGRIPTQRHSGGDERRLPVLLRLCNDTCRHRMTGSTSRDTSHYFIRLEQAGFDLSAPRNNCLPANSERVNGDGRRLGRRHKMLSTIRREEKSLPS